MLIKDLYARSPDGYIQNGPCLTKNCEQLMRALERLSAWQHGVIEKMSLVENLNCLSGK